MRCLLAVRNPELHARAARVAGNCCDTVDFVSDAEELRRLILKRSPEMAIAEACIEDESLLELVRDNPQMAWLIFPDTLEAWGTARFVDCLGPRVAMLPSAVSMIDLYCAVHAATAETTSWFDAHRIRCSRKWIEAMMAFPGLRAEDEDEDADNVDRQPYLRRLVGRFAPAFPGRRRGVSTLAALSTVVSQHLSGWLVLDRGCCRYGICFLGGLPVEAKCDADALDIFSFAETLGSVPQASLLELRKLGQRSELPNPVQRSWILSSLNEFIACGSGNVEFLAMESGFDHAPWFAENDLPTIFEDAVFHMPKLEMLDTMRMILPFRIRVCADKTDPMKLFSRNECKAVVERMKKSDRLEELLVYLPHGYPVHQTIYLLLAQGCLDIEDI